MGYGGGYYHQKLSENTYIVGFRGNGFSSLSKAQKYTYRRAAEIGSQLGYHFFTIDGMVDKSTSGTVDLGSTTTTTGSAYRTGQYVNFNATSNTQNNSISYEKPRFEIQVTYFTHIPNNGRYLQIYSVEKTLNANGQSSGAGKGFSKTFTPQQCPKWKQEAAKGNAVAQYNLGLMYANGEGVRQDYAEAMKWWKLAAAQGHSGAQYNLGVMYYKGEGVRQDKRMAKEWFGKACDKGDQQGCDWYRKLNEQGY